MTPSAIPNLLCTRACVHTHAHRSFNKARLPRATGAAYLLLPCSPHCYQPGLVHTYTLSATFCQTHSRCLWVSAHKLGNECYGGLSVSLGAWQPLHRLTSPVRRPRRQIYVTRVLMNTGSMLLETISVTRAGWGARRQWAHTRGTMAHSGDDHWKEGNTTGIKNSQSTLTLRGRGTRARDASCICHILFNFYWCLS